MSRKKTRLQSVVEPPSVRMDAAGIDISPNVICVAVDARRDAPAVRSYGSVTGELYRISDWLRGCGVKTVAMESTGVYWIPLFQVLDSCGFEVFLVNARHYRNVPGRKSDVSDAAWLQHLHAVGLLSGSFRPPQEICAFRTLLRHRTNLVQSASRHVQRMQKSLDQMNVQVHRVLSDITGASGLAIVESILAGERNGRSLAALCHRGVKASEEQIVAALEGDYRPEHLFTLQQSLESYRHYQGLIAKCDQKMREALTELEPKEAEPQPPPEEAGAQPQEAEPEGRAPEAGDEPKEAEKGIPEARKKFGKRDEEVRREYYRIFGVDLTAIPGVSLGTVQVLLAEIGPDLSRFRSGGALASWLGLCPNNGITGGKVVKSGTRKVVNRLTDGLRMAAESLSRDKSHLGQYYRRFRARQGPVEAITAAAHKVVRIIYHLITKRQEYDESQFMEIEQRNREKFVLRLARQARSFGYTLAKAV